MSDTIEYPIDPETEALKLTLNILIVLMLGCLVAGGMWYYQSDHQKLSDITLVQAELAEIEKQAAFYGALGVVETTLAGYPKQFDTAWFDLGEPVNLLLGPNRPWIDIAAEYDESLHPPDPVAISSRQAAFWYNPNLNIVRARVPGQVTEAETLALYNQVNNTHMTALPKYQAIANIHEVDPAPQPQPVAANNTDTARSNDPQPLSTAATDTATDPADSGTDLSSQPLAESPADQQPEQTAEAAEDEQPQPRSFNLMKPGRRAAAQ